MTVLRDGSFSSTINVEELSRGLRPSKRNPRNRKYLIESVGAVGYDKVLQVIDDLENDRIDTSGTITDGFPYPQIFVCTDRIYICDSQNIYDWDGSSLTLVLGPVTAGQLWALAEFGPFVYASNRVVAAYRDPDTGVWTTTTAYPIVSSICNFNGQIIVGSPVEEPTA